MLMVVPQEAFVGLILAVAVLAVMFLMFLYKAKGAALEIVKASFSGGRPLVAVAYDDRYFDIQTAKRDGKSWIIKSPDRRFKRVFPVPERLYILRGSKAPLALFNPWSLLPLDMKEAQIENAAKQLGYESLEQLKKKNPQIVVGGEPVSLNAVFRTSNPKLSDTFESILKRTELHTYVDTLKALPAFRGKRGGLGMILLVGIARTRVVGIFNPKKPMNQYPYPCMAVNDNDIFCDPPDITRWDLFLTAATEDVPQEDVQKRKPNPRPIPDDVFTRHVFWVRSRKPEHIRYDEETKGLIISESIRIVETYGLSNLPIVHSSIRDVLCRLSVAQAAQNHSTDESHSLVIAKPNHVEKAVEFYEGTLEKLKLEVYKAEQEGKLQISPSEFEDIVRDLGEMEHLILNAIWLQGKSSSVLASELDISDRTIKRHYIPLKKHGLISTTTKLGVSLSPRGIKFLKLLKQGISEIGTKNGTNASRQKQLGTENVPISPIGHTPPSGICELCGKYSESRILVDGQPYGVQSKITICEKCIKEAAAG